RNGLPRLNKRSKSLPETAPENRSPGIFRRRQIQAATTSEPKKKKKHPMTKSDSSETTTTQTPRRLLDGIRSPADIKALQEEQLPQLAQEVRDELIKVLSETGGHLGPNLGVVELTI